MATISNLIVKITANAAKFKSTLNKTKSLAVKWAKKVKSVVGVATKAFSLMATVVGVGLLIAINKSAAAIDNLAKTSSKLGIEIGNLQKLHFIFEQTGVSIETGNMALQRMTRRVAEAAQGTGEAVKALDELGVSAEDLNKLSPDKQLFVLAEAMKGVVNQGDKVRLAMKLFDSEGVALVNTMGANINSLSSEFDDLGITLTTQQASMVEGYQDAKNKLSTMFGGFFKILTAEIAPAFTMIIGRITKSVKEMGGMKVAANKFAQFIVAGIAKSIRAFAYLLDSLSDIRIGMLDIQETWLATTAIMRLKPFSSESFSEQLKKVKDEIDEINKKRIDLKSDISDRQDMLGGLSSLAADIELSIGSAIEGANIADTVSNQIAAGLEGQELVNFNKLREAQNELTSTTNDASSSATNLSDMMDKVAKSKAWTDIFGKTEDGKPIEARSFNFDQYAKLVKSNIASGDSFTKLNLNTLESILDTAISNQGRGFSQNNIYEQLDIQGMQSVVDSLNDMLPDSGGGIEKDQIQGLWDQAQVSQNVIDKVIQTVAEEKKPTGSMTLNMITDAGEIAGTIWAEPEFLTRFQTEVDRRASNAAKAGE